MISQRKKKKTIVEPKNYVLNNITPMGIEFQPNYFWFGDNFCKVLLITKYPESAGISWLSRVSNMEGVICSVHVTPSNPDQLLENISKSMGELQGKIDRGSALNQKRTEQQYRNAEKLIERIDQQGENVFYVTVAIMVFSSDQETLEKKAKRVESMIAGQRMKARTVMFKQEEALLAVSPYGICPQDIKDMADRNMPSTSVSASFPFNSSGLNDGQGIIFGVEKDGGIILIDTWKRGGDRTNSNWTVLGLPGVGKSTAVKHIFLNEWGYGSKIIIIDPEREYKELCENVNGKWINCGGGSGGRINPLQVKDIPESDDEDEENNLYRDEGKGIGALALHFQTLRTFFKLYLKDLDDSAQAILEEVLEILYARHGIVWDTDISTLKNTDFPILEDLYNLMLEKAEEESPHKLYYQKLSLLLRRSAVGADSALWNGHTTIEANSSFIVLDTHDLQEADDTIKRTQYFNILTWCWQQISDDRNEKILLGVDEAYLIVDPEVPQALQFLRNVSKRIRKYMGGLAVITHSVVDFMSPEVRRYGQALLDNPCFKLFMGADGKNLEELTDLMNLTEAEQEMLSKKNRGEGLLIVGSKRLHAKIVIDDTELEFFGEGGGK